MALSSFLIVIGGNDGGSGSWWGWWWRRWWRGVRIGRGHRCVIGDALEDGHQARDDNDDRPAVSPGDDSEGIQQKEDADESDPDGAAKGPEEPELIARRAIVCYACAGIGHSADEEPDAEADEKERNDPVT